MPLRNNFVLIDYENVQPQSLAMLEHDHFRIIVFVGANQTKLATEIVYPVQRMGAKAEYVQMTGHGKNALDFHIAYYIGELAASQPTSYFHIISKDTGFDPLIQHLKSKKILVSRSQEIIDIPYVKATTAKTPKERLAVVVSKLEQNEANRPRTLKTLSSMIQALFQKQLADEDVVQVIEDIKKKGLISVAENKVTYSLA